MRDGKLSVNEKICILGMTGYPLAKDKELAELLGFKTSTFTAIKNRVRRKGLIHTVRVPDYAILGHELLAVTYSTLNPAVTTHPYKLLRIFQSNPQMLGFHTIFESNQFLSIGSFSSYTELRTVFIPFLRQLYQNDIISDGKVKQLVMPYKLTQFYRFFDYFPILKDTFGIPESKMPSSLEALDVGVEYKVASDSRPVELTNIERRVLYGLVRYPDLPDNKVATRMNVTRQAVSRLRRELEARGIITTRKIPALREMGFGIMAVCVSQFTPNTVPQERMDGTRYLLGNYPVFLSMVTSSDAFTAFLFRGFEDYQRAKAEIFHFFKQKGYLCAPPHILLMSLPGVTDLIFHQYHRPLEGMPVFQEVLASPR